MRAAAELDEVACDATSPLAARRRHHALRGARGGGQRLARSRCALLPLTRRANAFTLRPSLRRRSRAAALPPGHGGSAPSLHAGGAAGSGSGDGGLRGGKRCSTADTILALLSLQLGWCAVAARHLDG